MGGAVTMGRLIMAFSDMPKGSWESIRARGSGCEGLDDSPRPEVLTFLAGVRRTELLRCEVVVVSGLLISYMRWGELEGTPPSKSGMVGAFGAWDVKSREKETLGLGLRVGEESVWAPLVRAMLEMEWKDRLIRCVGAGVH